MTIYGLIHFVVSLHCKICTQQPGLQFGSPNCNSQLTYQCQCNYSMSMIPPLDIWKVASSSGIRGLSRNRNRFVARKVKIIESNESPVEYLRNSLFSLSFFEHYACCRGMGENVTSNGLYHWTKHRHRTGICHASDKKKGTNHFN